MLKLLSLAIGADVTWLEVALGVALACLFYVGLVLALSI
jgi:hypothetical protein